MTRLQYNSANPGLRCPKRAQWPCRPTNGCIWKLRSPTNARHPHNFAPEAVAMLVSLLGPKWSAMQFIPCGTPHVHRQATTLLKALCKLEVLRQNWGLFGVVWIYCAEADEAIFWGNNSCPHPTAGNMSGGALTASLESQNLLQCEGIHLHVNVDSHWAIKQIFRSYGSC